MCARGRPVRSVGVGCLGSAATLVYYGLFGGHCMGVRTVAHFGTQIRRKCGGMFPCLIVGSWLRMARGQSRRGLGPAISWRGCCSDGAVTKNGVPTKRKANRWYFRAVNRTPGFRPTIVMRRARGVFERRGVGPLQRRGKRFFRTVPGMPALHRRSLCVEQRRCRRDIYIVAPAVIE